MHVQRSSAKATLEVFRVTESVRVCHDVNAVRVSLRACMMNDSSAPELEGLTESEAFRSMLEPRFGFVNDTGLAMVVAGTDVSVVSLRDVFVTRPSDDGEVASITPLEDLACDMPGVQVLQRLVTTDPEAPAFLDLRASRIRPREVALRRIERLLRQLVPDERKTRVRELLTVPGVTSRGLHGDQDSEVHLARILWGFRAPAGGTKGTVGWRAPSFADWDRVMSAVMSVPMTDPDFRTVLAADGRSYPLDLDAAIESAVLAEFAPALATRLAVPVTPTTFKRRVSEP